VQSKEIPDVLLTSVRCRLAVRRGKHVQNIGYASIDKHRASINVNPHLSRGGAAREAARLLTSSVQFSVLLRTCYRRLSHRRPFCHQSFTATGVKNNHTPGAVPQSGRSWWRPVLQNFSLLSFFFVALDRDLSPVSILSQRLTYPPFPEPGNFRARNVIRKAGAPGVGDRAGR
jgi:hypothetical protein